VIERIDGMGGMLEAIRTGWVQDEIHRAAYQWHRDVESGARVVVGVNRYTEDAQPTAPSFRVNPEVERERGRFLAAWRSERDARAFVAARARLERAARGSENLVPAILAALNHRTTLGEVCDTLRSVFGVHHPGANA